MAYTITETCIGCTACTKRCPTAAISGVRNELHVIDPSLCVDCGACGVVCPPEAIVDEAGAVCRVFPRKEWPKAVVIVDNCLGGGCEQCIPACPFEALSLSTEAVGDYFGVVVLNERKCTGCRLCEEACGWGAIYIDPPRDLLTKAAWPAAAPAGEMAAAS